MAAPVWLVLGPPASGKGTQSELLARRLDAAHLSSGQALRDTRNPAILARLASGDLARTEDFLEVVTEALTAVAPDRPVVLDSVGRMLPEAEWLVATLADMGRTLEGVIYIDVSPDESQKRAHQRGRDDDAEDAHKLRWQRFEQETLPVVAFYRERGVVREVDGSGTVDEVAARIADAIQ
jgi:adenylate kinase